MHYDVHQGMFASCDCLRKLDLQRRSRPHHMPRCNVEGNATSPTSRRPKFGIVGVSIVACFVISISEKTIQVSTAVIKSSSKVVERVVVAAVELAMMDSGSILLLELELRTFSC